MWDTTLVTMVRVLVNDLEDVPVYSDARLEQLIVVAATYVQREIYLPTSYTIGIDTPSISPDPTEAATLDDDFSAFVVLKAACLVDSSTYRTKVAMEGIKAKLGPAELEVRGGTDAFFKLMSDGPCQAYQDLKMQYMFGGNGMLRSIHAILSPFVSNTFDPVYNLSAYNSERYRNK